jgi:hypothetical protein
MYIVPPKAHLDLPPPNLLLVFQNLSITMLEPAEPPCDLAAVCIPPGQFPAFSLAGVTKQNC